VRGHGSAWAPAYQLAVVVDDAEMGVTDVVRGDDLIDSTPRQVLVYRALGLAERIPRYDHLPLVVGADGRRLAKRHGDTRLSHYRERGVSPGRVLSLLGRWCGVRLPPDGGAAGVLQSMLGSFRMETMPREPITMTPADDAWLRARHLEQ
jgi:glutamyl-tRNA synthetase